MTDADETSVRKRRERLGRRSEMFATWLLRLKGYRILGRRVRTPLGEIDLIAQAPSGMLCFVEVKMRSAAENALRALGPQQQMRIARAAELFLAHRPELGRKGVRFDVVTVGTSAWPRHLPDAWRPDWR
jgi:putative endonuclease